MEPSSNLQFLHFFFRFADDDLEINIDFSICDERALRLASKIPLVPMKVRQASFEFQSPQHEGPLFEFHNMKARHIVIAVARKADEGQNRDDPAPLFDVCFMYSPSKALVQPYSCLFSSRVNE